MNFCNNKTVQWYWVKICIPAVDNERNKTEKRNSYVGLLTRCFLLDVILIVVLWVEKKMIYTQYFNVKELKKITTSSLKFLLVLTPFQNANITFVICFIIYTLTPLLYTLIESILSKESRRHWLYFMSTIFVQYFLIIFRTSTVPLIIFFENIQDFRETF